MPGARGYHQYCPMAAALDLIGDRWALLVVRELLLGPRRFGELLDGLGRVGTDILTARLRQLEAGGVLHRTGRGRQQRYALTARGQALRPVLVELGRWGSHLLGLPSSPDEVSARVGLTALVIDPPPAPAGVHGLFELNAAGERARLGVEDGRVALLGSTHEWPAEDVTVVDLTHPGLLGLLVGKRSRQLASAGDLSVRGDRSGALRLVDTLRAPAILAGLHAPGGDPVSSHRAP